MCGGYVPMMDMLVQTGLTQGPQAKSGLLCAQIWLAGPPWRWRGAGPCHLSHSPPQPSRAVPPRARTGDGERTGLVVPGSSCTLLVPWLLIGWQPPSQIAGIKAIASSDPFLSQAELGLRLQKAADTAPKESGRGAREHGQGEQPVPGSAEGEVPG